MHLIWNLVVFHVVYLSRWQTACLFLSFVSGGSNSPLSILLKVFWQIHKYEVLLPTENVANSQILLENLLVSLHMNHFFWYFFHSSIIISRQKSSLKIRKNWCKNIVSCLKINLLKRIEITGKMQVCNLIINSTFFSKTWFNHYSLRIPESLAVEIPSTKLRINSDKKRHCLLWLFLSEYHFVERP